MSNFSHSTCCYDGEKMIQHIVHYENFKNELDELMEEYDIDIRLPEKSSSSTYTYANTERKLSYLDLYPETISIINRYTKIDFESLGYDMVEKIDENYSTQITGVVMQTIHNL